jgi:hypothetical protein
MGLAELEIREKEITVFEESLEIAREESQRKGVLAVSRLFFHAPRGELLTPQGLSWLPGVEVGL